MVSIERDSELIGMVSKEIGGNLWVIGIIWDVGGEPQFLCCRCSKEIVGRLKKSFSRTLDGLRDEELEILHEQLTSDAIRPLKVPEKYKDDLFVEEVDWTYRMAENGIIKCEKCGEIVI